MVLDMALHGVPPQAWFKCIMRPEITVTERHTATQYEKDIANNALERMDSKWLPSTKAHLSYRYVLIYMSVILLIYVHSAYADKSEGPHICIYI